MQGSLQNFPDWNALTCGAKYGLTDQTLTQ